MHSVGPAIKALADEALAQRAAFDCTGDAAAGVLPDPFGASAGRARLLQQPARVL
jgi:hypothetical protein